MRTLKLLAYGAFALLAFSGCSKQKGIQLEIKKQFVAETAPGVCENKTTPPPVSTAASCRADDGTDVPSGYLDRVGNVVQVCTGGTWAGLDTVTLDCGLTSAQVRDLHQYWYKNITFYELSGQTRDLYAQSLTHRTLPNPVDVIYSTQTNLASLNRYARSCKDVSILRDLVRIHEIPFTLLKDGAWKTPDGTENILASSQYLYSLAYLVHTLAILPVANRSSAMQAFWNRAVPLVAGTIRRWTLNDASWIVAPECNSTGALVLVPLWQSLQLKLDGEKSGFVTPEKCNRFSEYDQWPATAATELVAAAQTDPNSFDSYCAELGTAYPVAKEGKRLLERAYNYTRISNARCGHTEGLNMVGANSGDHWDISHARRLINWFETYSTPDRAWQAFAKQIDCVVFNGDYTNPLFTNALDGFNGELEGTPAYGFSSLYARGGYSALARHHSGIATLNTALATILARDGKVFPLPEGESTRLVEMLDAISFLGGQAR